MIQFNLLPDVKIEYIKAQKMRQAVISIAAIASAACIVVFVLSFVANQLQRKHLSGLNKDIASKSSQLKNTPQINNILTVQNQLSSLSPLHDEKPAVIRLFDYLNQLTPEVISLSDYTTDLTLQTVTIVGGSDTLSSVNKYVDTLKFTTYTTDADPETKKPAFTDVVLTSFGLATSATPGEKPSDSSFTISMTYDKELFNNKAKVVLDIPTIITTRSEVDKPKPGNDLFQSSTSAGGAR